MWLLLLTAFILYYVINNYKNAYFYWQERGISSVVKPWPLFGSSVLNLFQIISMPELIQRYYDKYSDTKVIGIHSFNSPVLIIKDLDLIKQINVKEFDSFMDHRAILNEENDPLFGKNLFSLQGQKWRDMRNTLSPAFTSSKIRAMIPFINDCANQLVDYYLREFKKENGPITVEMKDIFTRYTNDVIANIAFGIQCDSFKEKENEFYMAGKLATTFSAKGLFIMAGYMLFPRLMALTGMGLTNKKIGDFFRKTIASNVQIREKEGIIRPDMLQLLIQARRGQLKNEGGTEDAGFATVQEATSDKKTNKLELTDDDIAAQAFLFYFAGYDTSSTVMNFMSYELALNPDIQKRLQEEIDEVLKNCNGKVDYDVIRSAKYLDMVVSETLRKWPPGVFTERACTKSHIIKVSDDTSILIGKEVSIWVPVYSIHRDPKYYVDPLRFDPERFSDENKGNIAPFTYLPFGAGPRNCIGSRFALLEVKILFISLLAKFDIIVTEKTQIPLILNKSAFNVGAEVWLGLKPRTDKN